jgi:hypothetical protein
VSTKPSQDPERDPASGTAEAEPGEDDVEGHSLLDIQYGQQMAANRSREAAEWARGEKARREAERERKNQKGR